MSVVDFEATREARNRRRALDYMEQAQGLIAAAARKWQETGELEIPLALSSLDRFLSEWIDKAKANVHAEAKR